VGESIISVPGHEKEHSTFGVNRSGSSSPDKRGTFSTTLGKSRYRTYGIEGPHFLRRLKAVNPPFREGGRKIQRTFPRFRPEGGGKLPTIERRRGLSTVERERRLSSS